MMLEKYDNVFIPVTKL